MRSDARISHDWLQKQSGGTITWSTIGSREEGRGDSPLLHAILIALFLFCDQALGVPLCRFDQFVPVVFDVSRRAAL
jgi:hypothetical protein